MRWELFFIALSNQMRRWTFLVRCPFSAPFVDPSLAPLSRSLSDRCRTKTERERDREERARDGHGRLRTDGRTDTDADATMRASRHRRHSSRSASLTHKWIRLRKVLQASTYSSLWLRVGGYTRKSFGICFRPSLGCLTHIS